jgi:hypothetical protein
MDVAFRGAYRCGTPKLSFNRTAGVFLLLRSERLRRNRQPSAGGALLLFLEAWKLRIAVLLEDSVENQQKRRQANQVDIGLEFMPRINTNKQEPLDSQKPERDAKIQEEFLTRLSPISEEEQTDRPTP